METIIQIIARTAATFPDLKAVADATGSYTYAQMQTITNEMAATIISRREKLASAEEAVTQRVAVILPRTKDFPMASLGIMRAGCAYVPIEPAYPNERIDMIIGDSQPCLVVTNAAVKAMLQQRGYTFPAEGTVMMEDVLAAAAAGITPETIDRSEPDIEGMIIYTSGTTGKPKGVIHRQGLYNIVGLLLPSYYQMSPHGTMASMASFAFIAHIIDLYYPLTYGGYVYVVNEEERMDIPKLYMLIMQNRIECMFMPPKLAVGMIMKFPNLPLKAIICSGEKLLNPPDTPIKLLELYASSEGTAMVGREIVTQPNPALLGSCLAGMTPYLMDQDGQLVKEPGVVGEFCIVSDYLAMGYNNLPELTSQVFTDCPFMPGHRMYHSGDLMAWTADGELEFHGRKDNMVKVNGQRVELGEVESVMSRHEALADVACAKKTVNGGDNLCLYYVLKPGATATKTELTAFGAQTLPHYMVPTLFMALDQIPRNANGKIDRGALPEPAIDGSPVENPATPTEQLLHGIFCEVLGVECLDAEADLLSEGLNSMLAMKAVVAISEQTGQHLTVESVLRHSTIRTMAQIVDSKAAQGRLLKVHPLQETYPAHKAVEGYMDDYRGGIETLFIVSAIRIANTTMEEIERAYRALLDAHPSMKVKTEYRDGQSLLVRDDSGEPTLIKHQIDFEPDIAWLWTNCYRPVEVVGGYLMHYAIVETPTAAYFICHGSHAALDGNAIMMLFLEFAQALSGRTISKEEYTIYDYALDERDYMQSEERKRDEEYLRQLTDGLSESVLPFDDDPEVDDSYEARLKLVADAETVDRFCRANNIRQNSFFASIYMQALREMGGWDEVMVSSLQNNRSRPELARMMSMIIHSYPLVSRQAIHPEATDFTQAMLSDMRVIEEQVNRAMELCLYDYYGAGSLGNKSPNFRNKTVFIYYVGLTDRAFDIEAEKKLLGRDIYVFTPADIESMAMEKKAYDTIVVHVSKNREGNYEAAIVYNHQLYHTATMQKLATYMQTYLRRLTNG